MGNKSLAAVAAELKRAVRPVLAGHVMPDGDSIGSTLALGLMLEQLGKTVQMVSQDPIPATYRFLPADVYTAGYRVAPLQARSTRGIVAR